MIAIYKRELKACFCSVIGWLFAAVTLFLIGVYVTAYNLAEGTPYISYALQSAAIIFIVGIPVLTMRVLAEERRNKTDQLLLTSPVSIGRIVLGKYFAIETVFLLPCIIVSVYPLIMARFGEIPYMESYLAVLGFFLYGSCAISIGIFVSSLTESQVISAVLSVIFIFIGYIMPGLCYLISKSGNLLTKILGMYDLTTPYADLANGNLKLGAIFYYVSVICLMLFYTVQSIQKKRYSISIKNLGKGAYGIGSVIVVTALVITANVLIENLPSTYASFDITQEKLYSLTSESYKMMDSLQNDIVIYVLAPKSSVNQDLVETLNRYDDYSKHIRVEYIDISSNPAFANAYTDDKISAGSLIVKSAERSKYIDYGLLYPSSLNYETFSYEATGYDAEGQITSAIAFVTMEKMPKVFLLEGHGENTFEEGYLSALKKLNVDYEKLNLLTADYVPEDAQCIIINAPQADFLDSDIEKIRNYLSHGGNALFIYGYSEERLPHYLSLLEDYSVTVEEGMVIEKNRSNYYENMLYLLPEVEYNELTEPVYGNYVFAPYSCGIVINEEIEGESLHYLLKTTEDSFLRKNPGENNSPEKTESDKSGPFALGVQASRSTETGESKAVIFTSSLLFTEMADEVAGGNNKKLFTASVGSFVSVENSVSIPVKNYNMAFLMVPAMDFIIIGAVIVIILPLGLLIAGIVIWIRRRKR